MTERKRDLRASLLPPHVRVGDRPAASTINGILDHIGGRRIDFGLMPFKGSIIGSLFHAHTDDEELGCGPDFDLVGLDAVEIEDSPFDQYVPSPPYDCYGVVIPASLAGFRLRLTAQIQFGGIAQTDQDSLVEGTFGYAATATPALSGFTELDGVESPQIATHGIPRTTAATAANESSHTHTGTADSESTHAHPGTTAGDAHTHAITISAGTAHTHAITISDPGSMSDVRMHFEAIHTVTASAPYVIAVLARCRTFSGSGSAPTPVAKALLTAEVIS